MEFDNLSTVHVENMVFTSRYTHYEYGDKASKLLSHQLRQTSSTHKIDQIRTSTGLTTNPQLINDQFKGFYAFSILLTSQLALQLSIIFSALLLSHLLILFINFTGSKCNAVF